MARLLIIDERPVFRAGVRCIAEQAGIRIDPCEPLHASRAAETGGSGGYDLAVVSVTGSAASDPGRLQQAIRADGSPPVLAVTSRCEVVHGLRLLRLGAKSVIGDRASTEQMAEALRRTLAGQRYLSTALAEHLIAHLRCATPKGQRLLRDAVDSPEQLELVRLLALGKPISVICSKLRLDHDDLHAQRRQILHRAGLADEHELKQQAFAQHLVPDRRSRPRERPAMPFGGVQEDMQQLAS